jgi:hypothetical protein
LKDWKNAVLPVALGVVLAAGGCSSKSPSVSPASPSGLTGPTIDSPSADQQLDTLRPTLIVRNGSGGDGIRTYDFQVSESSSFSPVVASKLSVVENSSGRTSATLDSDLNPSTRYYWRARMVQGGTATDWTVSRFLSKVGGYNRPGELYDILSDGFTVGERFGQTTFVAGRGIRIENANSYVRYQLPETVSSGEFSMEVEGLYVNGPKAKQNVFSMGQGLNSVTSNPYEMTAQYRGTPGNPANCITFKYALGSSANVLEFNSPSARAPGVVSLDPGTVYFWQAIWGPGSIRLVVKAGGVNGSVVYDRSITGSGTYAPSPHTAYIGTPAGAMGTDDGSFPSMVVRNVWLSSKPRPSSLGGVMGPR